jgi:hypothetical protein
VVERIGGRVAARRAVVVTGDSRRMSDLLSLRAIELLRATSFELSLGAEETTPIRPPAAAPQVSEPPPAPVASPSSPNGSALDIDVGVALLHSFAGPPPAIMAIGRLRYRFAGRLYVRVTAAGLGSRPEVETTYGSAALSQSIGAVELGAVFRPDKRVRPSVFGGAGALNVSIIGAGNLPYEGRNAGRWAAAFVGGLAVAFAIRSHLVLTTDLCVLLAMPHPTVRFVDTKAATIGFPSLVLTVALQVAL